MLSVTQPPAMPSPDDVGSSAVVADAATSRQIESASFCVQAAIEKSSRMNAKRKPDKSKIFRIRTSDPEKLTCSKCRYEALSIQDLDNHSMCCKISSVKEAVRSPSSTPSDLRKHEDMANNNNKCHEIKSPFMSESLNTSDGINGYESETSNPDTDSIAKIRHILQQSSQSPITQQLEQSNLALEAIQNTRMALAQLASNAIANGQPTSPQTMHEMAVLQSTLYTLQHQHVMQLQLIQQLQAQLTLNKKEKRKSDHLRQTENISDLEEGRPNIPSPQNINNEDRTSLPTYSSPLKKSFFSNLLERLNPTKIHEDIKKVKVTPLLPSPVDSNKISESPPVPSSAVASSVIQHSEPPPVSETNALEMLQKTANDVLNNASQGLLTNRLIDDYSKPPDGKDSYYKHRCRYCGKVFGSDSALQIHVRSHTGERPFKCNICGNRFTTKGNLKVHFQRHSGRFPHIKMNPHPVPEHLDKFHPPLLAQLGELKDYPTAPTGPPDPFSTSPVGPSLPPFRLTAPHPLANIDLHSPFNSEDMLKQATQRTIADEVDNIFIHPNRRSISPRDELPCEQMDIDELSNNSLGVKEEATEEQIDDCGKQLGEMHSTLKDTSVSPDFHMPLREAIQNSLKERIPDHLQESIRTTIQEHFRDVARESLKDSLESSFNNLSKNSPPPTKLILENYKESIRDDNNKDISDVSCIENESSMDKEDFNSQEIRIRTEQDLKELSDIPKSNNENPELDSNKSDSMGSDQPTDLRVRSDIRPMGFTNMPFQPQRLPLNFPILPGLYPPFPITTAPPTPNILPPNILPNMDPSKDPHIYTNLLPRPGSNDNSWEALIEVEKTSETVKLEQLVNNLENKLSDPNQCIICHRVLSCKSALQMHYRTHTGERPFRCKICGRAFTTKGNLKTHMGVHRAKPPMRMLHQCPVCHKKYTNALVLQQHIRLHTGEPTDLTPEQIAAAEIRDFPPCIPTSLSEIHGGGFPLPPHHMYGLPLPMHLRYQLSPNMLRRPETDNDDRRDDEDKYLRPFSNSSRSSTDSNEQRTAEDLSVKLREVEAINGTSPHHSVSPTPSDYSDIGMDEVSLPEHSLHSIQRKFESQSSPSSQHNEILPFTTTPLDLASKPASTLFSPFGLFPPSVGSTSLNLATPGMSSFSPLYMPNMPIGGNTTCSVCLKMFACQSALEIHYRSHTKERPFRCTECDRKFSTKGNMKQHIMTHKMGTDQLECNNSNSSTLEKEAADTTEFSIKTSETTFDDSDESGRNAEISQEIDKSTDAGTKRERDGELSLPIPKRTTAISETEVNDDDKRSPPTVEVVKLKPEVSEALSNLISFSSTNGVPLLPSIHTSHPLTMPTSFPMPPSLSLPVSIPMTSSLSLPHALYPSSSAVTATHPLSNS